jgi:ketosteroid isomerase-like protein
MAGPLDVIAAARPRHPAPQLLVVTGGEAFPAAARTLPPHVQAMLDAEEARARGDVAGALAIFAENVEFHGLAHGPLAGPHHGHAGVVHFFTEWLSAFEQHESRLELMVDLGDRVVTEAPQRGRSRGVEVEMVSRGSWWLRDGKVVQVRWFDSLEEALAAR